MIWPMAHVASAPGALIQLGGLTVSTHDLAPLSALQDPSGHMTGVEPKQPFVVGHDLRQRPSAHQVVVAGQAAVVTGFCALHVASIATHVPSVQRLGVSLRHRPMTGQSAAVSAHVASAQRALFAMVQTPKPGLL